MTNNTPENRWDVPIWNVAFIALGAVISFTIGGFANTAGAGMAAIFLYWFPIVGGIGGILTYLISRLFFKKYNWILSLLVVLFILTFSTQLHFADFG